MKKHILNIGKFLFFLLFSCNTSISQNLLYGKYTELEVMQTSDIVTEYVKNKPIFFRQTYKETEFDWEDTTSRDTLSFYGKQYTVDFLSGLKPQYAGSYGLNYAYSVLSNKKEYIILVFYNYYQLGTEQQGIFIIFEINNDEAIFCRSYIENNKYRSSKVKIIKKEDGVYLKSKNLDRGS
jgi:hypothetical protein